MAEEDTMVDGMMQMMMVIMMIAVLSQMIPGAAQAAPSAGGEITVSLKNQPAEAELWQLILLDWGITAAIDPINEPLVPAHHIDIAETAIFEIPSGVQFPLRIQSLQITKWNEARTALIVLYEMQSWHPYLWDFDKNDWGDEPDPIYKEAFIIAFGHSYFDVSLEAFTS